MSISISDPLYSDRNPGYAIANNYSLYLDKVIEEASGRQLRLWAEKSPLRWQHTLPVWGEPSMMAGPNCSYCTNKETGDWSCFVLVSYLAQLFRTVASLTALR